MRRQRPGKQPGVCQASVCGPAGAGETYGCYIIQYKQYVSVRVMKQLKGQCWIQFSCECTLSFLHGLIKGLKGFLFLCHGLCVALDFVLLFARNTEVLKCRSDKSHEAGCDSAESRHRSYQWGRVLLFCTEFGGFKNLRCCSRAFYRYMYRLYLALCTQQSAHVCHSMLRKCMLDQSCLAPGLVFVN